MANTKSANSTAKTTTRKTKTKKTDNIVKEELLVEETKNNSEVNEGSKTTETVKRPTRAKKVTFDKNKEIRVKKNVFGKLVYLSRNKDLSFTLDDDDNEIILTFSELEFMRREQPKFFQANWIVVEDDEYGEYTAMDVYKELRVGRFYKGFYNDLDEFIALILDPETDPAYVIEVSKDFSKGYKTSIYGKVTELIRNHDIDSFKMINALETVLNLPLKDDD